MNKSSIVYGLCVIVMVLQVVAISTDYWSDKAKTMSGMTGEAHLGLWKGCGEISGSKFDGSICTHLPQDGMKDFPKNSLYACRAFSILGVILVFAAYMNMMMESRNSKKLQMGLLVAGGICSLIAGGVWAGELLKIKGIKMNPGYSFYLNMLGGVGALGVAAYMKYGN